MALQLSIDIKNSRLQVICDAIDALPARLMIYNTDAEVACEMKFPAPCQLSILDAVLTFRELPESMVLLNTEVTNATIIDENDAVLMQLSVGDMSSSADLKLPSTILYQGSLLRLKGWSITEL